MAEGLKLSYSPRKLLWSGRTDELLLDSKEHSSGGFAHARCRPVRKLAGVLNKPPRCSAKNSLHSLVKPFTSAKTIPRYFQVVVRQNRGCSSTGVKACQCLLRGTDGRVVLGRMATSLEPKIRNVCARKAKTKCKQRAKKRKRR